MLDSKYLKLILAIDQNGSLNKASKELNLTQSALSHQLKNLEDYLGIAIFHRKNNQLHFTEAGKELRDRAVQIIEELNALELRMQEIKADQLKRYIHGYSEKEAQRLVDQATSVSEFLHYDSLWEKGSRILEIGCGVGAQTAIISSQNKESEIVSIDISKRSIDIAKTKIEKLGIKNVTFRVQDVRALSKAKDGVFDHIFICFLLEHLSNPVEILRMVKKMLKPGGTITVIEGDHGSTFFYPPNEYAEKVVESQVNLQDIRGGNANIGRALYPLLAKAGYQHIKVSPRQIYVDNSKPELVEGFIKNTFTAMMEGISEEVISADLIGASAFKRGIKGLLRTTEKDGVFSYTFFKAKAGI